MLHHCSKGDWYDCNDGREEEAPVYVAAEKQTEYCILHLEWKAEPCCACNLFNYSHSCAWIHHKSDDIGSNDSDEDRNDLYHALSPDVADDDNYDCNKGHKPVCSTVVDGGRSQVETDGDDDWSCYYRWEELHDILTSVDFADQSKDKVQKTCTSDSYTGIYKGNGFCISQSDTCCLYSCISTQESEG